MQELPVYRLRVKLDSHDFASLASTTIGRLFNPFPTDFFATPPRLFPRHICDTGLVRYLSASLAANGRTIP